MYWCTRSIWGQSSLNHTRKVYYIFLFYFCLILLIFLHDSSSVLFKLLFLHSLHRVYKYRRKKNTELCIWCIHRYLNFSWSLFESCIRIQFMYYNRKETEKTFIPIHNRSEYSCCVEYCCIVDEKHIDIWKDCNYVTFIRSSMAMRKKIKEVLDD